MILFHGSNVHVRDIDLAECRPFKDFGQGFYLTDIESQAVQMANRVARIYGGTPTVSKFAFDKEIYKDRAIQTMTFDKPSRNWALFILNNRNREFVDVTDSLCNQDNKYDMVFGAVANDDLAYLFRTFKSGLIDIDALTRGLEYKSLTNQYSFHTERSLKYLTPLED